MGITSIMSSNPFNFIAVSFLVYGFCKKILLVNMRIEIIIVAYLSQSFCSTFFLLIKDFLSVITNSEKCGENENDTFNYSKRKYVVLLSK